MFTIHILNVKDWFNFLNEFTAFLKSDEFLKASRFSEVNLKMRFHGTLLLDVDGVKSVGDFEYWDIYGDGAPIGYLEVAYMDQHFFALSVEAIDALLSDDELRDFMLSGASWASPVAPIFLSLTFDVSDDVKRLIGNFVSNYRDDYPNNIARKFVPRAVIC
jgi:hypothetical protein